MIDAINFIKTKEEFKKQMAREHLLVVGWRGRGGGDREKLWDIHKEYVMLLLLFNIVRGLSNSLKSKEPSRFL